jgi:hypothetical protein
LARLINLKENPPSQHSHHNMHYYIKNRVKCTRGPLRGFLNALELIVRC